MQLPKHRLEKREILCIARSSLPSAKRDTMVESTITYSADTGLRVQGILKPKEVFTLKK